MPEPLLDETVMANADSERYFGGKSLADRARPQQERDILTREALADVDAGQVIDHQTVQAWVDSLDSAQPSSARTLDSGSHRLDKI